MFSITNEWKSYLDELNKAKLVEILKFYHELCACKNIEYEKNIEKKKKADIITLFFRYFSILSLFFNALLVIFFSFIWYSFLKKIVFKNKELEIPSDIYEEIKLLINNKEILKKITKL